MSVVGCWLLVVGWCLTVDWIQAVWIHRWRVTTRATQSNFRRRGVARQK
ncbi:MAG: hypothetical protein QNJ63_23955 [Calothrix sp. MO_192.B10]|nr:hypothetical protein [Calothrix sp. MO_192.B10]